MNALCDISFFGMLNKATATLPGISFVKDNSIYLLPSMRQYVFPTHIVNDLDQLYKSLYPSACISTKSGRAMVCGEIPGGVGHGSRASLFAE